MTDVAIPLPASAGDISAKVMSQCFEKWQIDVCSGTAIFTAYSDVGVVVAYNSMDHKGGGILMSLEIRRDYDVTYKPKVCLILEEKKKWWGRRRRKKKKKK